MRKVSLKDCGKYVLSPKISTNDLSQNNYITTDNMLPNKAGISKAENVPLNLKVTQFLKNDILLSNIRPYFKKIWLAEFTGGCSADVLVFRTNEKYDPAYIKYCLSQDSFFAYNMAGSKGSKMPRGDKNHILNFKLLNLDLSNQKKIGHFLKSIDDKIAVNNTINATLENLAKAIYEYYFVQFDFPDINGRPYKSSGGAMTFNQTLNRQIPQHFEVLFLKDRLVFERGEEYGTSAYIEGKQNKDCIKFYRVGDMDNSGNTYINQTLYNECPKVSINDLLVSFDGSVGRISYALNGTFSSGIRKIYDKENVLNSATLYFIFSDNFIQSTIKKYAVGTNILHAGSAIEYLAIPYNEQIYVTFQNYVTPIFEKMKQNKLENEKLKSLRDFLLPLLLNAQVRI
ncbi:restriction endonuclease subunit S [Helicobacter sp. T3_23-1059]